jgi:hypothetical protein
MIEKYTPDTENPRKPSLEVQKEGIEEQLRIAFKLRDTGVDVNAIDLDPIFERAQEIAAMPGINRADVAESLVVLEYYLTDAIKNDLSFRESFDDIKEPLVEIVGALLTDKSLAHDTESIELIIQNTFKGVKAGEPFVDALMDAIHAREAMAHTISPVDGLIDTKTDQVVPGDDEPRTLH